MPQWWIKAGIQRVISWLPNSAAWNKLFQQYVTRSIVLRPQQLNDKLAETQRFFDLWQQHGSTSQRPFRVLELGTGWHPIIPLGLHLCGAWEIWTFDIDSHLSRKRLTELLNQLFALDDQKSLTQHLPGAIPSRIEVLRTLQTQAAHETPATWLRRINIHSAVRDARQTGLETGAVDFIFSSGVLEYIPVPILRELLQEFRRVAAPAAVMVHRLNLVDQFAYFDRRLSPFHHLRYTDTQWQWRSSPLIWQNRIRLSDYRRLLEETGFIVKQADNLSGLEADLDRVPLAPEFQKYSRSDLLILHSVLTAVPAQATRPPAVGAS
jgi:SAM-dependent methyltransferase